MFLENNKTRDNKFILLEQGIKGRNVTFLAFFFSKS